MELNLTTADELAYLLVLIQILLCASAIWSSVCFWNNHIDDESYNHEERRNIDAPLRVDTGDDVSTGSESDGYGADGTPPPKT